MLFVYFPVLATVAICLFARPLGTWLGVMDHPDNGRKSHAEPTPQVGGIAVMVPLALWAASALLWHRGAETGLYLSILLCGGGVAVVGFMDDQRKISAGSRLLLVAIFSLIALCLDPALSINQVHFAAWGWLRTPPLVLPALAVIALTGFCSAVNMTDGLNGLVLALICIWSICLTLIGGADTSAAASVIAVTSAVTLLFNLNGRLFLGDCGAFAIAFVVGMLAIRTHSEGRLPIETALVWFYVPVLDCLRLIPLRLWRGRSPFQPDREHFHHRLSARLGGRWAIVLYSGVVGSTSLLATLVPQAAALCLAIASTVFFGFLLADGLASRSSLSGAVAGARGEVVRLERKHANGP